MRVRDINGNTIIQGDGNARSWLRRNRYHLRNARIDGCDCPTLMIDGPDGATYFETCADVAAAWRRAQSVSLVVDMSQRGTDFDSSGRLLKPVDVMQDEEERAKARGAA